MISNSRALCARSTSTARTGATTAVRKVWCRAATDYWCWAKTGGRQWRCETARIARLRLDAGAEVADAARAPDGSAWLLLRSKGRGGIGQAIAPLIRPGRWPIAPGLAWPLPKAAFDNYEGMAIAPLANGGWRFWLVTDDGHRFMARTLLVALDLAEPPGPRHGKSPAKNAGLSKITFRRTALGRGFRLLGQLALELGGTRARACLRWSWSANCRARRHARPSAGHASRRAA